MIGRGHDHRVHRTVVQQFAEIGISAGFAVGEFLGGREVGLVDVADGHDFGLGLLLEIRQVHGSHAAAADDADADAVVSGCRVGLLGEGAGQCRALE